MWAGDGTNGNDNSNFVGQSTEQDQNTFLKFTPAATLKSKIVDFTIPHEPTGDELKKLSKQVTMLTTQTFNNMGNDQMEQTITADKSVTNTPEFALDSYLGSTPCGSNIDEL